MAPTTLGAHQLGWQYRWLGIGDSVVFNVFDGVFDGGDVPGIFVRDLQLFIFCGELFLERQIDLLDPKLIVTLGRFSLGRFFPGESIGRARGKVREKDGRRIYPVMHPAAALHRQELRSVIIKDFSEIPAIMADMPQVEPEVALAASSGPQRHEAPAPEQLSLF